MTGPSVDEFFPTNAEELANQYGEHVAAEFFGSKADEYRPIYDTDHFP